jgi:hypothetical protein
VVAGMFVFVLVRHVDRTFVIAFVLDSSRCLLGCDAV